ncbi:DUF998 domain-containing protein [Streptomyces gamaensis]|uniref:DUF998 domain-containing protein n=1 Tax=Streptomyces gamaensis TaxID=1763542 RepID=A0ABW0Z710_9ACTN
MAYSAWILEYFLDTGLSYSHAFVSELSARDQPYRWLFGGADAVAGVLATAAAAVMLALRPPRDHWATTGWLGLAVFGISTAADVLLFPLDCAVSQSTECRVAEDAGRVSLGHQIHTGTSALAGTGLCTAAVTLSVAVRGKRRLSPLTGPVGRWLVGGLIVATVATLVLVPFAYGHGVPQRAQVGLATCWLVAAGLAVRRATAR